MGEGLVVDTTITNAEHMLKVIGGHDKLYWEWSGDHLDVAAWWLPQKGFKILPKIFDCTYQPGTVGDEGDRLITSVRGCRLRPYEVGEKPMPLWTESVLELPQTRAELKRIVEDEGVLDMSFEEEVAKYIARSYGSEDYYKANEETLSEDRWTLKRFGEVLALLADCMEQVHRAEHVPLFFEFSIPR